MAHDSHIGEHCFLDICRQRDFLPFTCTACARKFCIAHFKPEAHGCPSTGSNDKRAFSCPLCLETIAYYANDDIEMVFNQHSQTTCKPHLYSARDAARKQVCPVPRCREKLTVVNSYVCKKCRTKVCVKHRFESDHDCQPPPSMASQALSWLMPSSSSSSSSASAKAKAKPSGTAASASSSAAGPLQSRKKDPQIRNFDVAAELRATAHRRQQQREGAGGRGGGSGDGGGGSANSRGVQQGGEGDGRRDTKKDDQQRETKDRKEQEEDGSGSGCTIS
uniref:AN1-type domain-containing protein n=1 Tax=Chromera velia CCMP2878 TaxID=1169474 RepID=A0A0G4I3N0_9ALVE|eukprot:Cvel_10638.t1-p1 / transcript=Cvel_10638.t1 / gene=Cvel_10638 / organism=Chromera_velia_CCMP2878 / gene_product=Zinc finger AN1 and C2H2 domain-containing, putative / transcript_product=Zinc finger AN1 and C2H2 domain-containing, putative / location=Cvel_scaffold646:28216-31139(-) / protein_length=276 / sequence_SO=supercontig / SO=protein_coding / is_pseudo=false